MTTDEKVYGEDLNGLMYIPDDAECALRRRYTVDEALARAAAVTRVVCLMLEAIQSEDPYPGDEEIMAHVASYADAWIHKARSLLRAERAPATKE
jgi:hypothetical protein